MRIVVCVKHVPDVQSERGFVARRVDRSEGTLNELDENAVEAALRLVEADAGEVVVLTVGPDDAVRYTVVIRSAAGASTVNVEGIRCDARERKLYAFGRPDSTWSPAKSPTWTRITNVGPGSYQYVLLREYFCPGGISIRDAAEGIDALKRGGHPANQVR